MTGIFRSNNPLNASLLFVYGLLLRMGWYIGHPLPDTGRSGGFLYDVFYLWLQPALTAWPSLHWIFGYLLLYFQAMVFNYYFRSRKLLSKPNYLPAMSYLLITSFFAEWNVLSAPLVINSFLIWVWAKLSLLTTDRHVNGTLYNLGLAIGLCSFLYYPILAFMLLVFLALMVMRPPKVAEWILHVLGVATIWYLLFAWLFVTDRIYDFYLADFRFSYPIFSKNGWQYAGMIIMFCVAALGFLLVQTEMQRLIIQVRKRWTLIVSYVLVAMLVPFINKGDNFEYWILAALPLSAFIAAAFFYIRSTWVRAVLHWGLIGFVIYVEFFKPTG